jgi:DHA2 family multidrug resistance protein-like MFS transporter
MDQGKSKWWALAGLSLAVLAVGLDGTVLSVALPTLATALHASESDLQWFSSGYLLVLAAAMLPAGLLGDRYGRKKVLLASLVLFGAGSALTAYSPNPGAFIAARLLLGVAGAGIIVMVLSALTVLFTAQERPRAVGIWSGANFVALPIGPILGGWLLTHYWWGWVFLINLPVTLIGLAATALLVPESKAPRRPGLDAIGIATSAVGLVTLTYGLIEAGQHGWDSAAALIPMIGGVAVLAGFFQYERWLGRRPGGEPLVELKLFSSPSYTWGVILVAVAILGMIGVLFTIPQYYQGVLGTDAMGSGLRLLPLIGGLMAGAVPADRVVSLIGAKSAAVAGFAVLTVGLLIGARTGPGAGTGYALIWMAIVGAGMGLALATSASAALAELSPEQAGVGSAVLQAVNKTGGPFGSAILGSVLLAAYHSSVDVTGLPAPAVTAVKSGIFGAVAVARQTGSAALLSSVRTAFTRGMDAALWVTAGFGVAGLILAAICLPQRPARKAAVPVQEADPVRTP